MSTKIYDALIIGGGPAGLAMALALARQAYATLVLDSGAYRNARARHMHMVPGFDHADPAAFRAKVRADLAGRYAECVEYRSGVRVAAVRRVGGGEGGAGEALFEAVDEGGAVYTARKLGLAMGVRDVVEGMPEGYDECWARGIFHCLYCHGYEERGVASVGVFAGGLIGSAAALAHVAPMAKRLAQHVTIYTNASPALQASTRALLHSSKITFDDRRITGFQLVDGGPAVRISFADGATRVEGFVVNHPSVELCGEAVVAQLGLERTEAGEVSVGAPFGETSVAGCFAAGDAATGMRSAVQAVQMGGMAGIGMATQLQRELDERDEL